MDEDNSTSAQLLANALGYVTDESTSAISSTLSYFRISPSKKGPDKANKPGFFISVNGGAADSNVQAEFDPTSRRWHLIIRRISHSDEASKVDLNAACEVTQNPRNDGDRQYFEPRISPYVERPIMEDWTELLPRTKHAEFLKSRNWAATSLGPMRHWPSPLRMMTMTMLVDPRAVSVYWGPTRTAMYNEPFIPLAASRHPAMMAATTTESMPATWVSKMFDETERTGLAISIPDFEMRVKRADGVIEEAWYDGVILPIRGGDGQLLGIYNAAFETTDLKMSVRRSRLLHRISAGTNLQEVTPWKHIVDVCQDFDKDIPMLVVYSTVAGDTAQSHQLCLQLEGSLGMERGHGAIPEILELHDGKDGFIPALQTARLRRRSTFLEMPDGRLPDFLAQDVRWRCFEGPPTSIVITPLFVTGLVAGFLIIGTNPRRPSDETHKQFVESLGHVSTELLCSSVSYEQARAREVNISRELTAQEKFIRKVAEVATVGLFNQNMKGLITWANSRFYAITGISEKPEDAYGLLGMDFVLDEDKAGAIQVFEECISLQIAKTTEFRLKKKWVPPGSVDGEYCWILASATPSVEDGEVTGVMGCVTDISHLKWAEQLQINTAEAAKEAKRQQERFIDTTSHEIRNPLSAIVQCADGISTVSQQTNMHHESDQGVAETFDYILESARTILFCVAHQKRIVDDILTVSKLDSSMLAITPVCVDPSAIVMQALEMVETELSATDIHSNFSMNQSYIDLNVKYVYCDPTRLTQILVNLLTNALKFTKTAQKREVRVRVGASTKAPRHSPDNTIDHKLQWFPSGGGSAQFDARDLPPMGTGEEVYISFEVQDTGRGISGDEMSLLFNRFPQASPKTHVQYGGSGLGLFISRELTELQGGMIGISSIPGEGSTFAFYVKTRKATPSDVLRLQHGESASTSGRNLTSGAPETRRLSGGLGRITSPKSPPPTLEPASSPRKAMPSVILVEDNLINQTVLSKQLRRLGCTVHIANHGVEALDLVKTTRFWREQNGVGIDVSVILMDWEMPVMDGLTCTEQLRVMEQKGVVTKHLPVIATTANARPEQVQRAFAAGVDDLLAKPFTVSALMDRIEVFTGDNTGGNIGHRGLPCCHLAFDTELH